MALTPASTSATCGMSNGSASVSVSGGVSPYTYAWSNGGTTSSISGIPSGSYTVTVTDNNLCTKTTSANVSNTGAPTLSVTASVNVNCFGGNNGSASISATGGTPGYTYSWSTGATTTSVSGLTAGTYSATVTDAIGCQATNSVVITQPTQVISSITASVNPGCFGTSTGTATVAASGGTPGYTYLWSNGQTTANATGLSAGSYTVTVRDANNCSSTSSVTLSQPSQVSANITANTPVSCFGGSNGTATVSASGGTPGYTYSWSNGNSNAANSGLIAGSYTVTVTDTKGCTATTSVLINQPANLLATIPNAGNVSCFGGSNGQAVSNVTGGTIPYTYSWSNSTSLSSITGVAAGTYTLTVTDNNLCTATASVTVTEPTQIQASTSINNNVSCPGGNNGSASVSASGGTPIYFYSWSNGSSNTTVMGLPAGTHSVTVSDANMCTTTATVVISEPSPLIVNLVPDSVNCFGTSTGAINANPSGGTFPYTFLWSNGATTQNVTGLNIGNYTVTMTDINNCTSTQTTTLNQPLNLSITSNIADAHCGLSDGSIEITCTGGTPGYTYLWDAAAGSATTNTVTGIPSATYYVTVTDAQNCTYVHFFSISDIGAPQVTYINQINNVCFGDSTATVTADITGGITPYTINWSTGSNVATINDLGAGTYYLTVTDHIGCETFSSVAITQPLQITAQVTGLDSITCYGLSNGSVTVQGQGGTPGYTYHWENQSGTTVGTSNALVNIPAGQYYLTITDINNCTGLFSGNFVQPDELIVTTPEPTIPQCFGGSDGMAVAQATGGTLPYTFLWSNSVANDTTSGLTAGPYTVTATDANGCSDTYTINVSQPTQIVVSVTSANSTCSAANGEAYVSAAGGTPGYTFNWSNGITNDTITGLSQGNYSVTAIDSHGCNQTGTVNVGSQNAGSIQVVLNNPVNCYGDSTGAITVSMNGGTAPFTFTWSHNLSLNQSNATGLPAGSYSVTIVDANYCITDTSVTVSQPSSAVTAMSAAQDILCYNFNNGMINVTASGGTSPYTYLWSNSATIPSISGLTPGVYSLTITDSHNCQFVIQDTITEPEEIIITQTQVNPLCHNTTTGSVSLTVNGGTVPYTYLWNNGGNTNEIQNVTAGQYMATVTDQNGCPVPVIAVLFDPPAIQYTAEYDINTATNNGYITIVATGGQQPYTYTWSNGAETASLVNLPGGWYTMTLTDANGCFVTDSFFIDIPLIIPNMITPNKDGINDDFEIQNIEAFESVSVEIYNRWGDILFVFEGSGFEYKDPANRWKGTFNGKDLPMGSYVYIVKIEGKDDPYTGAVSIKR
jgi:gliding motility-associated-like protein